MQPQPYQTPQKNVPRVAAAVYEGSAPQPLPRLADLAFSERSLHVTPKIFVGALRAIEFMLLTALGLLIAVLYVPEADTFGSSQYLVALVGAGLAAISLLEGLRLYTLPAILQTLSNLARVTLAWAAALGLLVAAVFFLKIGPEFSRVWLATWFLAGAAMLVSLRLAASMLAGRWMRQGRLNRRAVVYGAGPASLELLLALEADPHTDIRIAGVFDDGDASLQPKTVGGYPALGRLDDLIDFARSTRVDLVLIAVPMAAEDLLMSIVRRLWILPVDIKLASSATRLKFRPRTYSYIGNVPLIDLADKPIDDWGMVAKSAFDRIVGLVALILLAPVMLAVAIAVRMDSRGPILFKQKRYGFNNELIEIYKFRSMYTDRCDASASRLVTRDDPRVTPVGRFIRKTSLDELPQLFNVLKGDLSLVGPRPHALQAKAADKLYDEVVDSYFARHRVKPGITGWAQINGWRGETDTPEKIEKRVEHDLYYIENWSLLLDVYILLKTPLSLLKGQNAY